jgi:hypothetical protein
MELELEIEALALHGLTQLDAERFGAALQFELERKFATQHLSGRWLASGDVSTLDLKQVQGPGYATPEALAASVAQALYDSWQQMALQQTV